MTAAALLLRQLIGAALLAMVALTVVQIVLRYVFAASLVWVEEVSVMLMTWMAWLGVPLLWLTRRHIAVELALHRLSPPKRRVAETMLDVLAIAAGLALAWVSLGTVEAFSGLDIAGLELDASIKYWPVPVGGVGLALAALATLAQRLRAR